MASLQPLDGGISALSFLAEVKHEGRAKKWVLRHPGDWRYSERPQPANREFNLLKGLLEAGLQVCKPVAIEPGESPESRRFYVMEFMEGVPVLDPPNVDDFVNQHAEYLAHIHALPIPDLGIEIKSEGWKPDERPLNDDLHETLIRKTLAELPVPSLNSKVLNHGDPWPGNTIWKNGKLQGFIDWEEVCIADPLYDLGICRLDVLWICGQDGMEKYTRAYISHGSANLDEMAYWDLCASLRPIRWLEHWSPSYPKLGRPDITTETMTASLKWFIEDALERATGSKP